MEENHITRQYSRRMYRSMAYTNLAELYEKEVSKSDLQNSDKARTNRRGVTISQNISNYIEAPKRAMNYFFQKSSNLKKEENLFEAATEGKKEEVEKIITQGIDVNKTDALGRSAIVCAAENRHLDVVKTIVMAGADFESINDSLQVARNNEDFDMVVYLKQVKEAARVKEDKQQKRVILSMENLSIRPFCI